MSLGYKGGIISATPPTTTGGPSGTASGIWSLQTQLQAIANGDWPTPPILYSLYTWGANDFGGLGYGLPRFFAAPTQVTGTTDWAHIDASVDAEFVAGVKTDGTLWAWGNNNYGQLGQNDVVNRSSPTQIGSLTNWSKVVLSAASIIALKTDGTVWSWGINTYGQLGHGDTVDKSSPVQISSLSSVSDIAGSVTGVFVLFLKSNGLVYSCGYNAYGQLGIGDALPRSAPTQITAISDINLIAASPSGYFAAAIDVTNQVLMWGRNNQGQLGIENTITYNTPQGVAIAANKIALGQDHTVARKTDGTLWGWGDGASYVFANGATTDYSSPIQIGAATDWVDVYASSSVTGAIKTNGTVWTTGNTGSGQLGIQSETNPGVSSSLGQVVGITSPSMVVGGVNAMNFLVGNTWYGSGYAGLAGYNLFGLSGEYGYRSSPVQVGSNKGWKATAFGEQYGLFISKTGALYSSGRNLYGQLGLNNDLIYSSPVQIGSDTDWSIISASVNTSYAIKTNGTLWAWGRGGAGRTGQGDEVDRSSPTQIGALSDWQSVSAGANFAMAIKTDGTLWGWGAGNDGRLAQNSVTDYSSPVQVGALTDWAQVSCGAESVLALKTDGTLWAWGRNANGTVGDGTAITRSSPVQIGALTTWAQIASSAYTSAAIKTDGTLWAWGFNGNGAVGINSNADVSSPVQIGSLTTWASVNGSQGDGTSGFQAIKTDGTLWSWGNNGFGALGDGTVISRSSPVQIGSLTTWSSGIQSSGTNGLAGALST